MTRWGAQLPARGSADTGPTGTESDDGDEPTIDRAQLEEARTATVPAYPDGGTTDDDVTISREALEQLRNAHHESADTEVLPEEETVTRAELDQRHAAAEPSVTAGAPRRRRDVRTASTASTEQATAPAGDADGATEPPDAVDYFRDASTIPYATLMSLRATASTPSVDDRTTVFDDASPSDVRTGDENVTTRSIHLPLPSAELAREPEDGDEDDAVPEETLPAPVTHEVAVSARTHDDRPRAPRSQGRANDHTRPAPVSALSESAVTVQAETGAASLASPRRRLAAAPRRMVAVWIVAALTAAVVLAITLSVVLKVPFSIPLFHQAGSAAGLSAGRGETNVLLALASSPKDATRIASDGGAEAIAIAVVDFSADGGSVSVLSLRPDTWTAIPDHGEGTLSDALSLGGAEALRATLNDSLGIRIDYTIVITESGLTGLALSGDLDIVNPAEVATDRFTFPAGPLTLNPSTAVDYLKSAPQDLIRQQAVLDGAARLLIARGLPTGSSMGTGLAVLPEFGDDARERLTTQLRAVDASGIVYGVATTTAVEERSRPVAALDEESWQRVRAAFAADDVASHLRSATGP